MLKQHHFALAMGQRAIDIFLTLGSWLMAYYIRFYLIADGPDMDLLPIFLRTGLIQMLVALYFFDQSGLYESQRFNTRLHEVMSVFKGNTLAFLSLVIGLYFFEAERISRGQLLIYFTISIIVLISWRLTLRSGLRIMRERGHNLRHVLLVGNGQQLSTYCQTALANREYGVSFLGWQDSNGMATTHGVKEVELPVQDIASYTKADVIVVGYKNIDSHKTEEFLRANYNGLKPIQILPDLSYAVVGQQVEDFAGIPLITFNQPKFSVIDMVLKRSLDVIASGLGLLVLSPFLSLIALAVKLSSPGPIFYGQQRMGFDGKLFMMWKFRSMKVAADNADTKEWSNKSNPRKTKVGDFLRRTSLDELPQLFNVFIGQMSLVGPRPEQPYFIEKFKQDIPGYMLRHKMKAGITGWAQVNGWRGDTSLEKRLECDIFYIKNWSLAFDLKILALTFLKGFVNKNAY